MTTCAHDLPATPPPMRTGARERGAALIEFAFALPLLLILVFAIIDFGHLVQTRLIMTNVSREGASIASRDQTIDPALTTLLTASGRPLDLGGADGRIVITRLNAGESEAAPNPTTGTSYSAGQLAVASRFSDGRANLGLTPALHDHLVFDVDNGTADISDITVVEVFYRYRPITPLSNFLQGMLQSNGGGLIFSSRAIF
jgi:hypothetical protein